MKRVIAETAMAVGLAAGIVGTGVALVSSVHESRRLFQELELLKSEEDRLQDDWTALQLETHTLARHDRIDDVARSELGMVEPGHRVEYVEIPR